MTQGGADAGFDFVVYLTLIALGGGNDAVDPDAPLRGQAVFQKVRENGDKVHVGHVGLRGRIRLRGERHARRLRLFGVGAQQLVDHGVRAPCGKALDGLLLLLKIAQDAVGVARAPWRRCRRRGAACRGGCGGSPALPG